VVLSHLMFTRELGVPSFAAACGGSAAGAADRSDGRSVVGVHAALALPGCRQWRWCCRCCAAPTCCAGGAAIRDTARRTLASFGRLADELLIVVGATVLGVVIGAAPQVRELAAGMTPALISGAPLLTR
jgi:hypothetical protein